AADDVAARPAAIAAIRQALKLENATLARLQPRTRTWLDLPAGVTNDDLAPLAAGTAASGHHGRLVYAAASTPTPRGRVAVVLTRKLPSAGGGLGFFLIAAALALVIAGVVGDRLGHRIAKPLEKAEAATRRIATGDLDARVPVSDAADPEVASLATSINTMAENLARLRGLERNFLLSVSHDLRTPLTSIRGFAEAIADGATDDDVRAAGVIAAEARRLERLVGDLLDLARLDARQFSFDVRDIDVADVVTDTAEGFRPAAAAAGVELALRLESDDAPLLGRTDPERLAQVVANLVENALKFARSRIDVVVERGDRHITLVVTDDGPGIPSEDLDRVFDRLYQPNRDGEVKPRQVGSGLGLAIVAELIAAMDGTVHATAAPDGGTRMIVTLRASSTSSA
ncbi:MAG TPA: HAMP domain-containing sensor histidine kinase, partial [Acidimicrobiales bacterium]|nr:HAMP domain-containing sensor histidine kinase [Acidimicrobiales bacterium]